MNRSRKIKQDAIIILTIVIVGLLLWQLFRHSRRYGGVGGWAVTNIIGSATLTAVLGEPGEQGSPPPTTQTNAPPPANSPSPPPENRPPGEPPSNSPPVVSTNLANTNGPVTVIDVPSADLVPTAPGVTYASNVSEAATIAQRLGEASAKGGDIQISLYWNNYNDLDLHCIDPRGEEIWFPHTRSASGGELDVDRNAHSPYTPTPVENIYWPDGGAPSGLYKITVVYYAPRNGMDPTVPTAFTVRLVVKGWTTSYFRSTIGYDGTQRPKPVCTLDYEPHETDPARRFRFVR